MYFRIIKRSELKNSWLPADHIPEAKRDELQAQIDKLEAAIAAKTTKLNVLKKKLDEI